MGSHTVIQMDGCNSTATCIIMMFITTVHKHIERKEKKTNEKEENEGVQCRNGGRVAWKRG